MNIFVTFSKVAGSEHASFYSVVVHDSDVFGETPPVAEFDRFVKKYKDDKNVEDELSEVLAQIEIFKDNGVSRYHLREENKAFALPAKDRRLVSAHYLPSAEGPLRLYCILLPDDIVILCNGGRKTGETVQLSPGVRPYFSFAQTLASRLTERLAEEKPPLFWERIESILDKENIYL